VRENLNDEFISLMKVFLGLMSKPNAGRGAREDEGPLWQCCALRKETDNLLNREDEISAVTVSTSEDTLLHKAQSTKAGNSRQWAVLHNFSILQPPEMEFPHVRDQTLVDQDGANRAGAVKALRIAPLGLGELRSAA
jgi:hypothetical protein